MSNLQCHSLCSIIDRLETGVIVLNSAACIVHWNRWVEMRSGHAQDKALDQPLLDLWPEIANTRLAQAIDHAIDDGLPSLLSPALHGTLLPLFKDENDRRLNRRMQQLIHVLPVRDAGGEVSCIIQVSDMTANLTRERLLRQQAETLRRSTSEDPLTGLLNRRKFEEALATEFRKAQRKSASIALVIADIDLFADYNALYGRDHGDQTLAELAGTLRRTAEGVSDSVGRFGGDEIAFILTDCTADEATAFSENLRLRVAASHIPHAGTTTGKYLTISIGTAMLAPDDETDTHTLVSSADVALFQAKHEGRNRAIFFSVEDGSFRACA